MIVELPDGRTVEFPEGMSEADVSKVLASETGGAAPPTGPAAGTATASAAPQQISGPGRAAALVGSAATRGLAVGTGLLGDAQSAAKRLTGFDPLSLSPANAVRTFGNALLGRDQEPSRPLPTSNQLVDLASSAGLTNRSDLIPGWGDNPRTERMADAIIGGAASAVPQMVLGGGVPGLVAGAVGGAAGGAAQELQPNSKLAPVAAGLAAGTVSGAISTSLKTFGETRALQAAAGAAAEDVAKTSAALEAAKTDLATTRLLNPGNLAATRDASRAAMTAEHAAANAEHALVTTDSASQISQVADALGTSKSLQSAGEALQTHARDWLTNVLPAKQQSAWAPLDAAIPAGTAVPRTEFSKALSEINSSGGSNQPLLDVLTPRLPAKLAEAFSPAPPVAKLPGSPPLVRPVSDLPAAKLPGSPPLLTQSAGPEPRLPGSPPAIRTPDLPEARLPGSLRLNPLVDPPANRLPAGPRLQAPELPPPARLPSGPSLPAQPTAPVARLPPGPTLRPAQAAAPATAEQSWKDAQTLRSAIGDAMSNPMVVKDIPARDLARLYAAQTADMKAATGPLGASDLFDAANAESSRLYSVAQGPIGKIVSGPKPTSADPNPGEAAKRLLSGASTEGTDLATLRSEIPKGVDELAAAQLRTGDWNKLSPEAQRALLDDPHHHAAVNHALTVAEQSAAATRTRLDAAKQLHQQTVADAQSASRTTTVDKALEVQGLNSAARDARTRSEAAQAALPVDPAAKWTLRDVRNSLVGPEIGSALGVLGTHFTGESELMGGALGLLGGVAIPAAMPLARWLVRNPSAAARSGLAGAVGGSNVLYRQGSGGESRAK